MGHCDVELSSKRWAVLLLVLACSTSFWASSGSVQWMDNGQFLAQAADPASADPSLHPLFQWLMSWAWAVGGAPLAGAANAWLLLPYAAATGWLGRGLGLGPAGALAASAATVLAHGVFWQATKASPVLLLGLCTTLAWAVHCDRSLRLAGLGRLWAIGALGGLALSVHPLALLLLAPLGGPLWQLHRTKLLLIVPAVVLGSVAAWPAVLEDFNAGLSAQAVLRHYLTGFSALEPDSGREAALLRWDLVWHEKNSVMLLMLSLIGPQLAGVVWRPAGSDARALWYALWLGLLASVSFNVFDRFCYFVPCVGMAAALGVLNLQARLAAGRLARGAFNASLVAGPVLLLTMWGLYAQGLLHLPTHKESLPYRDDIHYLMVPWLPDRSAAAFAHHYESAAPAGALILSDETPLGALRSAQAAGLLQGRQFEPCANAGDIGMFVRGPGAYLPRTSYCERIVERYRLNKRVVGYQLEPR